MSGRVKVGKIIGWFAAVAPPAPAPPDDLPDCIAASEAWRMPRRRLTWLFKRASSGKAPPATATHARRASHESRSVLMCVVREDGAVEGRRRRATS